MFMVILLFGCVPTGMVWLYLSIPFVMSIPVATVLPFNNRSALSDSFTMLPVVFVILALMFIRLPIFAVIGVAAIRSVFLLLVHLTVLVLLA